VRDAILAGYRAGKPFLPYVPTCGVGRPRRVLDFGCGLGRNTGFLASVADEVVGFDLPEMVDRARGGTWPRGVRFEACWDVVRAARFDLVFVSLVFQHVAPDELGRYLEDLVVMAPRWYVLSRGRHDFGGPTMRHVASHVRLRDGVLVDHDPVCNGLAVVGPISASEMASLDDERHVEVVLETT
jgi:SAM-dependent methyltransferase